MYCARGGKKTLVLGSIYGSQTAMGGLYENYPGFPEGINGIELSERMLAQAQRFGAENQTELVEKIDLAYGHIRAPSLPLFTHRVHRQDIQFPLE